MMAKSYFKVPMGKEILDDAVFRRRVGEKISGNIRTNLKLQVYDFALESEAEALALVLTFENPDSSKDAEGIPPHIFRVDRLEIQSLVDRLYNLVKYQKSEPE